MTCTSSSTSPYHPLFIKHQLSSYPSPVDDETVQQCIHDIYAVNQQIHDITSHYNQFINNLHTTTRSILASKPSINLIFTTLHTYEHQLIQRFNDTYQQYLTFRNHFLIYLDDTHHICIRIEEYYTELHRIYDSLIELHAFIESNNNDEIYIEYHETLSQIEDIKQDRCEYDLQLSVDSQHEITSHYVNFMIHNATDVHDIHVIDAIRIPTPTVESSDSAMLPIRFIIDTTLKSHEEIKMRIPHKHQQFSIFVRYQNISSSQSSSNSSMSST